MGNSRMTAFGHHLNKQHLCYCKRKRRVAVTVRSSFITRISDLSNICYNEGKQERDASMSNWTNMASEVRAGEDLTI